MADNCGGEFDVYVVGMQENSQKKAWLRALNARPGSGVRLSEDGGFDVRVGPVTDPKYGAQLTALVPARACQPM